MPASLLLPALLAPRALALPPPPRAEDFAPPPPAPLHHALSVSLDPEGGSLAVRDRLELDPAWLAGQGGTFELHAGLSPAVETPGWSLELVQPAHPAGSIEIETWRLAPPAGWSGEPLLLSYGGRISHPPGEEGPAYARSFSSTPGTVGPEGAYLAGSSYWVPDFGDALLTFELSLEPDSVPGWSVVSQGRGSPLDHPRSWVADFPTEEVYLVAGPWTVYRDRAEGVDLLALLRGEEPGLARRYLGATGRYLRMYEQLLGPFPYASFAVVENFWETGYGMPGFTLLGPQVLRFPWILASSYPHELLHDWWGNGVYVGEGGNWCEGLTAYLADHLLREQRGEGVAYRRDALRAYTDFAAGGQDFPLSDFSERHSASSEAVGYDKALMVFHMLRRAVGDEAFVEALRAFYVEHRFQRASWDDLARAFSAASGRDWGPFVREWVEREGAPRLGFAREPRVKERGGKWQLSLVLEQQQDGQPFPLDVPVRLLLEGGEERWETASFQGRRRARLALELDRRPLRLDVDPAYDCMRLLDPLEVAPTLSAVLGDEQLVAVLPSAAPEEERRAWRELARAWEIPEERVLLDDQLDALPAGAVLLGWDNRLAGALLEALRERGAERHGAALEIGGVEVDASAGESAVLVARAPSDERRAVAWVAGPLEAVPGLARKLPHYGRYSFLAFTGPAPDNRAKQAWEPLSSPMSRVLAPGGEQTPPPPERPALAELPPLFDPAALMETVRVLAAPEMEGRGLGSEGLARAADWVEERMRRAGLQPVLPEGYRLSWTWVGGEPEREMELTDLLGLLPGTAGQAPVLVMAHLDHLGYGWPDVHAGDEGELHPGADDNASGVAVLLALAGELAAEEARPRPVVFAVTTGEEAGWLGSRYLLEHWPLEQPPAACVVLDTVGRLDHHPLLVLDAQSAREWPFLFMGVSATTGVPVQVSRQRLDSSDQVACIERGIPAVQLFSGAHADYHRPTDTPDRIDPEGMARVAEVAREAVAYLAERGEPLHPPGQAGGPTPPAGGNPGRKVALGTVPDFSYQGEGVCVQEVRPGSPAERAGIQAGDVLVAVGGEPVEDLRGLARVLAGHEPGEEVEVEVLRGGQRIRLAAVLEAR